MRIWLAALAVLFTALVSAPAQAGAKLIDFGMYEAVEGACEFKQPIGHCDLTSIDHVATATEIPGSIGITFGLHYSMDGVPTKVRTAVIFPPGGLKNPRFPNVVQSTANDETCNGVSCYTCYTFDFPWEVREGIWTMQVWANGRVVLEKKFRVVLPDKKKPKKGDGRIIAAL